MNLWRLLTRPLARSTIWTLRFLVYGALAVGATTFIASSVALCSHELEERAALAALADMQAAEELRRSRLRPVAAPRVAPPQVVTEPEQSPSPVEAEPFEYPRRLHVSLPGEPVAADLPSAWFVVAIDGRALSVEETTQRRAPDWTFEARRLESGEVDRALLVEAGLSSDSSAIAMPAGALFAVRPEDSNDEQLIAVGTRSSLLQDPWLLEPNATVSLEVGDERWTLSTEHSVDEHGAILDGSLALFANSASGVRRRLVRPAGMAFQRQELLWIARTPGGDAFDFILRRTWLTGEFDYYVVLGGALGQARVDPDHPYREFSSGIGDYATVARHVAQRRPWPQAFVEAAGFWIGPDEWNAAYDRAAANAERRVIFAWQMSLGDERVVFTAEYVPRYRFREEEHRSTYNDVWAGPVVVVVEYRNQRQVLVQAGQMDSGFFRAALGRADGELALKLDLQPHYNNSFTYHFVWSEKDARFVRLGHYQSQGC